uniref:Uncharacterized protein n=1 Tax=Acrobeloides nanus TaxID=290746 RepID=A0A914CST5_9BILA
MGFSSKDGNRSSRPAAYSNSNERNSRSYRSPPLPLKFARRHSPRDDHRSRREATDTLSPFYRERFGSHSPEDYLNLRLSRFDSSLTKEKIRRVIEDEFYQLRPFEIKIVRNPDDDEQLAYVNFERPNCAKEVRRSMIPRLQKVLGRRLMLDPTGVLRDQEGKYVPDRFNRAQLAVERERSPGRNSSRRRTPPRGSKSSKNREGNPTFNLNQDDTQATRTLFVGNLPGDVRESEIRRVFEIYGVVEEVDIKVLSDNNAAYAFIQFKTVDQSIEARKSQHNKPMRPGSSKCQIGYGKSQVSRRLWVGGLGDWCTEKILRDEFDRYGMVEDIEYDDGDEYAYIKFADKQAASDACREMKNFPLGGPEHRVIVDFAKDEKNDKKRKRGHSSSSDSDYSDRKRRRSSSPSLSASPSRSGYIETLDELKDEVASTWKGLVILKKAEYPLRFYRVFGKEHLLQDLLRDDDGNALKLNVNQRLPLDNNFYQKMIDHDKNELALMVAVEGDRPVESLVKYLSEKNAAGVVTVDGGVVYILSNSETSDRLVKFFCPRIALIKPGSNYLLVALKKSKPATT